MEEKIKELLKAGYEVKELFGGILLIKKTNNSFYIHWVSKEKLQLYRNHIMNPH